MILQIILIVLNMKIIFCFSLAYIPPPPKKQKKNKKKTGRMYHQCNSGSKRTSEIIEAFLIIGIYHRIM